jgi:hypothetical protein
VVVGKARIRIKVGASLGVYMTISTKT